jgi:hypothetical protein
MNNPQANRSTDATTSDRIDVKSEDSVRQWADHLAVTADQIRDAVAKVGDRAADVELHLKGSRSTTNDDRVDAAGG